MFWLCFGSGCGIWAVSPSSLSIETTTMNTMISVSNTSISGVTLISGPRAPPPASENDIENSPVHFSARVSATSDTSCGARVPVHLSDGLGRRWQGRRLLWRRRWRRNCIQRRGRGGIKNRAQRRVARRKEVNGICGKENNERHRKQRYQEQKDCNQNTSYNYG